ncbi:SH3 domain-containing protein [Allocoleopsis franciscana]|uniref:SH3 domain-containing protein n=1 Tax=Allocoleopsis franciscana PCC 7113 TaxID=1173027 RepID=K9WQA6_9CYAN|nr:SH3 domain-containing protein [Allocoleopsis franciscana]AFZ21732.1 SH3 domain-containing protein [Allocoleopsis franciscana PCC 7113]
MKKMSRWGKLIAFLALILLGLNIVGSLEAQAATVPDMTLASSLQETTTTSSLSSGNIQLAQLVGQCRAATRTIDIFTEPSVGNSSDIIKTLEPNQQVTLAGEGSAGWIQVSSPASGYVIARYLKSCGTNPPPTTSTCRRVTASSGLVIRSQPTSSSSQVGSVLVGTTVKVTGASSVDSTGRTWVEISTPRSGWVSSGFPSGNLSASFSCI